MDLPLGFVNTFIWFLVVTGVMHEVNNAYLIWSTYLVVLLAGPISHNSTQYMDFVEIFYISLDLSTIYFSHFSRCSASFVYSCHSILECYNLFSGVKLSIRACSHEPGTTHCPGATHWPRGQLCLGARSDACDCSHEFFVAPGQLREAGYPLSNTG